eukprot:EG_transcript_10523
MRPAFLLPVLLAAVVGLLTRLATERPIAGAGPDIPVLGQGGYDVRPLQCPIADGYLLKFLAWLIGYSPVGPIVRRFLLNANGAVTLREMGAQAQAMGAPLLFQPLRLLNHEAQRVHRERAAAHPLPAVLRKGLGPSAAGAGDAFWSVDAYAEAYRSGRLTPSAAVRRLLAGMKELEGFKMWMEVLEEDLLEQAAASDERFAQSRPLSWLDGVPVAIKDMLDVKGYRIRGGTMCEDCPRAAKDCTIAARFRAAGALIVGTTIMTELGVTPVGWNANLKATVNPYNTSHYPGGSSSGSGVAVATGLVPIAIGVDGGGSIRIPSSMCGIFGLAATFGRIPLDELALGTTMMHVGPMTATVRDAAYTYALLAPEPEGPGPIPGAVGLPPPHLHGFNNIDDLSDVVLGIFWDHFEDADPEIVAQSREAVKFLQGRGATVVNISIPSLQWLSYAHGIAISCEFSATFDAAFHAKAPFEANTQVQLAIGNAITAKEFVAANRLRGWAW